MTMNYTVQLDVCDYVKLTAPCRTHHVLKLMTTSGQIRQVLSMQQRKVFSPFITATHCTVHEVCDARSATHCIDVICSLAPTPFSVK